MPGSSKKIRIPLNGILILKKPASFSSNNALIKAKGLLNAQKAGHTGTLDPFATGVLPICFGEATKFSQALLGAEKTYETLVHLGVSTTTGDTEGKILERKDVNVTREQINAILMQFRGQIKQVPPMYSALKHDGKALYKYARAGITLKREARDVTIHRLELLAYEKPFLRLLVACSKGTYIRVLGEDIGTALGCGAHLKELQRIKVGHLSLDGSITLEQLRATKETERFALLAPIDSLLFALPKILLSMALAKRFLQGQCLRLRKGNRALPAEADRVRVYLQPMNIVSTRQFLGTAQLYRSGILSPERLITTTWPCK